MLLNHFRHCAGAHRAAAFSNREPQTFLHGDRRDQLDVHRHVVSRHHHLHSRRQRRHSRHVRGPEVKLWAVSGEERRVSSTLFLRQHIGLGLELRVRCDRARFRDYLAALNVLALNATQQQPYVVSRHAFVQQLLEHLHARYYRLYRRSDPYHLYRLVHLHHAPLHSPRRHRPATLDREDVFHRHQKRLLNVARRRRNITVNRRHQLFHRLLPFGIAFQSLQRRTLHHRNLVPRKLISAQQLSHFQLHQLQQLRIVHRVRFVHEHHHRRHSYLPRQQNMLSRLRHRTIGSSHYQYRSVHLRRPRDHVLHIIRVPWTVHVRVVPGLRLILHVRRGDRDPPRFLFRRLVDLVKGYELHLRILLPQYLRDRRRQRRLPVIHVPDGPDVHVRL